MKTMFSPCARRALHSSARCALALVFAVPFAVSATPPGWTGDLRLFARETSGADLSGYQVRVVFDSATLIGGGEMNPDAHDLRFASDAAGKQPLAYWIESGVNTDSTVVWVRLPSIPAHFGTEFHLFYGNPAATGESTLDVFDFVDEYDNSATNRFDGGSVGGVTNSQRGFRFLPNEDVLLTHLGKREPNGTTRYITLFDVETQAIIVQSQVSGPAATYAYKPLVAPIWLRREKQYLLEMYQGNTDGYYFGSSTQINPRLTYLDMRYCNGCTQDTYPTNYLNAIHYGYPDFLFRTRAQASSEPTVTIGGPGPTRTTIEADAPEAPIGTPVTFSASLLALLPHTPGSTFTFSADGNPIAGCIDLPASGIDPLTASCTVDSLILGAHSIQVVWSGDADNENSASDPLSYTVVIRPTQTVLGASQSVAEFGTPALFMASVNATNVLGEAPGGTFSFTIDGNPYAPCTNLPPQNTDPPSATCATNSLWLGSHPIQASWSGDTYHEGSASDVFVYEVTRLATQTQLASGCAPVFVEGQTLTLQAAVGATFTPIGMVDFAQNGAPLCLGAPIIAGAATCVTSPLQTGGLPSSAFDFTASYAGDDINAPSTSLMLGVTVLSAAEAIMHNGFDSTPGGCPNP